MSGSRYADDEFLGIARPIAAQQRSWAEGDAPLPTMYLSHGAPPLLDDAAWMQELFAWSQSLPKPKAVLLVSAHWEQAPLSLSSAAAATPVVYDFGGFDQRFYRMSYDTPDASELAGLVSSLIPDAMSLHHHASRGLDHGAWIPMRVMYPLGDIPVLQLSMPTHDPAKLMDLGRRLTTLREHGVLIIGSGYMTHGLPFLTREMFLGLSGPAGWSTEFDAWAKEAILAKDVDTLADYANAPGMPYAHPTVEHFTPLFVTLGAADLDHASIEMTVEGYGMGLSKRSFHLV